MMNLGAIPVGCRGKPRPEPAMAESAPSSGSGT
jgi:hypothetical protein